ncbi:MAG TPA: sugar dehydrogenase complex small subunit [Xanthobacteraceae bacterium]|nr:sugar dehydrogenase complex small subunit [Xanthobacteraceae bacterium]
MKFFTRRKMLSTAVATAATAVGAGGLAVPAAADDAQDVAAFVGLSAALTGIDAERLAPGVDPVQVKKTYFKQAKQNPSFGRLLEVFRANQQKRPETIADIILNQSGPDLRFLGRSIMLAWYLGHWYEPDVLMRYGSPTPPVGPAPFKVISPTAYTQGWAWRVAQSHPMGYSEWRFGYWAERPPSLDDFIKG